MSRVALCLITTRNICLIKPGIKEEISNELLYGRASFSVIELSSLLKVNRRSRGTCKTDFYCRRVLGHKENPIINMTKISPYIRNKVGLWKKFGILTAIVGKFVIIQEI
jgi:hypothetical protein